MRRRALSNRPPRRGLSLVEVLVAIVVFGIATTGLAAMTFWVGTRSAAAAVASHEADALRQESEHLAAIPFDSLDLRAGCDDEIDAHFSYGRCVRVDQFGADARRVTLVLTPLARATQPDTLVIERIRGTPYNPFQ